MNKGRTKKIVKNILDTISKVKKRDKEQLVLENGLGMRQM